MADLTEYERNSIREYLAAEWGQARAEVGDYGNSGWCMVAKKAIEIRCRLPGETDEINVYRQRYEDERRENQALALELEACKLRLEKYRDEHGD